MAPELISSPLDSCTQTNVPLQENNSRNSPSPHSDAIDAGAEEGASLLVHENIEGRTSSQSSSSLGPADIVYYVFEDGICQKKPLHLNTVQELEDFFKGNSIKQPEGDYLLLVEDASDDTIKVIDKYANSRQTVVTEHVKGRVNREKERNERLLHADRVKPTLFDQYNQSENLDSMTWWKLFSQSRNEYAKEMDALRDSNTMRMTVPHFEIQLSDTHTNKIPLETDKWDMDMSATLAQEWNGKGKTRLLWKLKSKQAGEVGTITDPQHEYEAFYELNSDTYRPHQVITEVQDEMWGVAAEERITCNWFESEGLTYYILFFDKPRGLREFVQTHAHSQSTQDSPSAPGRIFKETGHIYPTFLSSDSRNLQTTNENLVSEEGIQVSGDQSAAALANSPQPESQELQNPSKKRTTKVIPQFPISTRTRFIEKGTNEGLLYQVHPAAEKRDKLLHRARLTLASMAADDWNLVLSQMASTLDGIDSKMSDKILLQSNALAWRRLLCSWRVSMVEYGTRLEEMKSILQPPLNENLRIAGTFNSGSYTKLPGLKRRITPSSIGEEQKLLQLFHILVSGLHKIEERVDRSFQAIMSSMSIIESERAIIQGAAVTRLTEVAFFFIPLSFAATFFSMQVHEFEAKKPHLSWFFGTGFGLIVILYIIRTAIRSTILKRYRIKLEANIRETSRVPGTEDVPTRVIVSFLWTRLSFGYQAIISVAPISGLLTFIIIYKGHSHGYKAGSVLLVMMASIAITGLLISRYILGAMRLAVVTVWMLSLISAALGGKTRLNPGLLGTICTVVTTVCAVCLASIPQSWIRHVWLTLAHALLPLWTVMLPITVLYHFDRLYHWEPYRLTLSSLAFLILYGLLSNFLYASRFVWIPRLLGIGALTCGIPLTLTWTKWPMAGRHYDASSTQDLPNRVQVPVKVRIAITVLCGVLYLALAPAVVWKRYRRSNIWWYLSSFIVVLALPVTLTWYILPFTNNHFPLYAKIIISAGTTVLWLWMAIYWTRTNARSRKHFLFCVAFTLVGPLTVTWALIARSGRPSICLGITIAVLLNFSLTLRVMKVFNTEAWRLLSWMTSGVTVMSWIPLFIWIPKLKVFFVPQNLTKSTKIHVTWTTTLAFFIIWVFLWKNAFSPRRKWLLRHPWKDEGVVLGSTG